MPKKKEAEETAVEGIKPLELNVMGLLKVEPEHLQAVVDKLNEVIRKK